MAEPAISIPSSEASCESGSRSLFVLFVPNLHPSTDFMEPPSFEFDADKETAQCNFSVSLVPESRKPGAVFLTI